MSKISGDILFDNFIDDSVFFGFFGRHPVITVHIFFDLLEFFASVFGKNFGEAFFEEDAFF